MFRSPLSSGMPTAGMRNWTLLDSTNLSRNWQRSNRSDRYGELATCGNMKSNRIAQSQSNVQARERYHPQGATFP